MAGIPKLIIAALLGATVTGAGAWLTWASDIVTESKAIDLIENYSPYAKDQALVKEALEEVKALRKDLSAHTEDFARLDEKLSMELRMHHGAPEHQ